MDELNLDALEREMKVDLALEGRDRQIPNSAVMLALIQRLREAEAKWAGFASDSAFFGQQYANVEAQIYELKARLVQLERVREAAYKLVWGGRQSGSYEDVRAALAAVEEP